MTSKFKSAPRRGWLISGVIMLAAGGLASCEKDLETGARSRTESGAKPASPLSQHSFSQCFTSYVYLYADLKNAYQQKGAGRSIASWGYDHYQQHGITEGRNLPDGCNEFARGGGEGRIGSVAPSNLPASSLGNVAASSAQPAAPRPSALDYRLVHQLNASFTGGTAVRWKSRNITLQNFEPTNIRDGVKPWVNFKFNLGKGGIVFKGDSNQFPGTCGWAIPYWYKNYELARCDITINIATHTLGRCGSIVSTITHEVGHCLGVLAHTTNGSLMDAKANGSSEISEDVQRMLNALYVTPLNAQVSAAGTVSVAKELIDRGEPVRGKTIFIMPEDKLLNEPDRSLDPISR